LWKVCTTVATGRSARRTERGDRDITMSEARKRAPRNAAARSRSRLCRPTLAQRLATVTALPVASPSGNGGTTAEVVSVVVGKVTPVKYDSKTGSGQKENGVRLCEGDSTYLLDIHMAS